MSTEGTDRWARHHGATPRAELGRTRTRLAASVEAISRLQRDLRDRLPDAAHHLDLALGDLLDAYDVVELASATARPHEPSTS